MGQSESSGVRICRCATVWGSLGLVLLGPMVRIKRVADLATDSPRRKVAGSRTEAANHRFHGLFRVRCRAPQPNRLEGERFGEPSAAASTPATVRLLRAPANGVDACAGPAGGTSGSRRARCAPNSWGHPYPWVLIAPLEIESQQAIE